MNEVFFREQVRRDSTIASLDPLGFDDKVELIGAMNHKKDINGLKEVLYQMLPYPEPLQNFSYEEAAAAMRDIGILLGSLKRHGIEPVELVPELDYVLDILAQKCDLPPRDTLLHYTVWNPKHERIRTYTNTADERELIESVRMATPPLLEAILYLLHLQQTPTDAVEYKGIVVNIQGKFRAMVDGIIHARKHVSPEFFANELRLYFDPIQLYQQQFLGPGAVEMPVFVYDHILWSNTVADEEYTLFKQTYLPYILPELRDVFYKGSKLPSVLDQMISALQQGSKPGSLLTENAKELFKLTQLLKTFRMPHLKVANSAYKSMEGAKRMKGSGGYSPHILEHIIKLTNSKIDSLEDVMLAALKQSA